MLRRFFSVGQTSQIQRLFVYGSLAPGKPNEHILTPIGGQWEDGTATLKGTLKQEGWGAAMGFPGIVPDNRGQEVKGLIYASEQLEQHWQRLDAFEGDAYQRKLVEVTFDDGKQVEAFVYALKEYQ